MISQTPDYGSSSLQLKTVSSTSIDAQQYAKNFLTSQIEDPNYTHELSAAQLWAIKKDSTFHLLSAHPDVYELLEQSFNLSSYIGVLIHTTGWAAPLGENGEVEGRPSEHEQARRVALASCVTSSSTGSALSFSDDEEIVLDPGSATGSLASALVSFWETNQSPF